MSVLDRLTLVLLALQMVGCTRCSKTEPDPNAASAAGRPARLIPGAGVVGTSSGAAVGSGISLLEIPARAGPEGSWTPRFEVARIPGDENLSWREAVGHCREHGKALCLAEQWQRVCELDDSAGSLASWTLTADATGAQVRGGPDGCRGRSAQPLESRDSRRIGLCCSRVVVVTSDDRSEDFGNAAAERILELERTIRDGDSAGLAKLLAAKLSLDGNDFDRERATAQFVEERKADPERTTYYERCTIKVATDETPATVIADCDVVQRTHATVRSLPMRIVFAGIKGPVVCMGDPKSMRPKERKERVKSFLQSD